MLLADALLAFEDQAAIGLYARLIDPRDDADHPARADRSVIHRVLAAEVGDQPGSEPRRLIPNEPVKIIADRMIEILAGDEIDSLVNHGIVNMKAARSLYPMDAGALILRLPGALARLADIFLPG